MSQAPTGSLAEHGVSPAADLDRLIAEYREVRGQTESLCAPLEPEDFNLQAMPDASPAKWHLAHTTWFFETFVLATLRPGYRHARADANFLFNSYYNAVGERIARDKRGLLSRPTVAEVQAYRSEVDDRVERALANASPDAARAVAPILIIGLNHEQQHQELLLTDLKIAFGANPTRPAYRDLPDRVSNRVPPLRWLADNGGVQSIGHSGEGFAFDNETPRHRVFLEPFALASRPSTNGEYLAFLEDGGYERPEFWLSDGWASRKAEGWQSPLYWERSEGGWATFTLGGMKPLVESEPVTHVSFYEADAFARWNGARLPTEAEWEVSAAEVPVEGNLLESGRFHPETTTQDRDRQDGATGLFGDNWEWTSSPYIAYPGFRPATGALGEYNGKFMCNQMILRGGSCATPSSHVRATYRNFFGPASRWQFTGIRLAR